MTLLIVLLEGTVRWPSDMFGITKFIESSSEKLFWDGGKTDGKDEISTVGEKSPVKGGGGGGGGSEFRFPGKWSEGGGIGISGKFANGGGGGGGGGIPATIESEGDSGIPDLLGSGGGGGILDRIGSGGGCGISDGVGSEGGGCEISGGVGNGGGGGIFELEGSGQTDGIDDGGNDPEDLHLQLFTRFSSKKLKRLLLSSWLQSILVFTRSVCVNVEQWVVFFMNLPFELVFMCGLFTVGNDSLLVLVMDRLSFEPSKLWRRIFWGKSLSSLFSLVWDPVECVFDVFLYKSNTFCESLQTTSFIRFQITLLDKI